MSKNKTKILVAALELFNNSGVANVRLLHISDACIVSVGKSQRTFDHACAARRDEGDLGGEKPNFLNNSIVNILALNPPKP